MKLQYHLDVLKCDLASGASGNSDPYTRIHAIYLKRNAKLVAKRQPTENGNNKLGNREASECWRSGSLHLLTLLAQRSLDVEENRVLWSESIYQEER